MLNLNLDRQPQLQAILIQPGHSLNPLQIFSMGSRLMAKSGPLPICKDICGLLAFFLQEELGQAWQLAKLVIM